MMELFLERNSSGGPFGSRKCPIGVSFLRFCQSGWGLSASRPLTPRLPCLMTLIRGMYIVSCKNMETELAGIPYIGSMGLIPGANQTRGKPPLLISAFPKGRQSIFNIQYQRLPYHFTWFSTRGLTLVYRSRCVHPDSLVTMAAFRDA